MNLTIFLTASKGIHVFCLRKSSLNESFVPYDVIKDKSYQKDHTKVLKGCARTKLLIVYDDLRPGSDNGLIKLNRDFISASVLQLAGDLRIPFAEISGEADLSSVIASRLIELFNFFPDDRVIYFNEKAVFLIENHAVQKVLVHSPGFASSLLMRFHSDLIITDESLAAEINAEFSSSDNPPKIKVLTNRKSFNGLNDNYVPFLSFITGASLTTDQNSHFAELKKVLGRQSQTIKYIKYALAAFTVSFIFLAGAYNSLLSVQQNNAEAALALSESADLRTLHPWLKQKGLTPAEYTDSIAAVTSVTETALRLRQFIPVISEYDSTWINTLSCSGNNFAQEGYTISRDNIFRMMDKISDFRISKIRTLRFEGTEFFLFTGEF